MQTGYLKQSWHAMTSEKGWVKQILLLALVQFIPIFGQIVLYGYLYNWAKDAAWGVKSSFPHRKLFSEKNLLAGLYAWAIIFIWAFVLSIVSQAVGVLSGAIENVPIIGFLIFVILELAIVVVAIVWGMMSQVAALRATIYNSFSPCVQIKPVWTMFKKDWKGQLKIFCISLLMLIPIIILIILFCVIVMALAGTAILNLAAVVMSGSGSTDTISRLVTSLLYTLPVLLLVGFVFTYVFLFFQTIITGLVIRSLGIWCSHFDVPRWKGQNDPLPFETVGFVATDVAVSSAAPEEPASRDAESSDAPVDPSAVAGAEHPIESAPSDNSSSDTDSKEASE
jgi:hypothetical protein